MKTLTDQLAQYATYHRDRRNIATHLVGIPMILLALQVLLSRPVLADAGVPVTPWPDRARSCRPGAIPPGRVAALHRIAIPADPRRGLTGRPSCCRIAACLLRSRSPVRACALPSAPG